MPNIRKANDDDSRDIFDWRNDELTRQMSHTSDFVDWNGHSGWCRGCPLASRCGGSSAPSALTGPNLRR